MILLLMNDPQLPPQAADFLGLHSEAITVIPAPGDADIPTRMCAAINALDPVSPLTIAAVGSAALSLPAVARSQRAHHRRVSEYVLLDPEVPAVSDAWPDARVTVICGVDSEASLQARLRGWDVLLPDELAEWQTES